VSGKLKEDYSTAQGLKPRGPFRAGSFDDRVGRGGLTPERAAEPTRH
jgi:hypothetical protein